MKKILMAVGIAFMLVGCGGSSGGSSGGSDSQPFDKRWSFIWTISKSPGGFANDGIELYDVTIDCDDPNMPVGSKYGRQCRIDYTNTIENPPVYSWRVNRPLDIIHIWEKAMIFSGIDVVKDGTVMFPLYSSFSAPDVPVGQCQFAWDDSYIDNIKKGKTFIIDSIGGDFECRLQFAPFNQ